MTLISSISKIGSINTGNKNHSIISNKTSQTSTLSFGDNNSSNLVYAGISANLLYILGIHVEAKVL